MDKSWSTNKETVVRNLITTQSTYWGSPLQTTTSTVDFVSAVRTSLKAASATPSWKALVKSGARIPVLPYRRLESVQIGAYGAYDVGSCSTYKTDMFAGYPVRYLQRNESARALWMLAIDGIYMNPPLLEPYVLQAQNLAKIKLLTQIKDSKVNLAQAYAESAQVHKLIGSTAIKLAKTFQHLRKGQLLAAGSVLGLRVGKREAARYKLAHSRAKDQASVENLIANGVLSVQYGIKPLISDIIGLAELVAQKQCREVYNKMRSSKTLKVTFGDSRVKRNATWNSFEPYTVYASMRGDLSVTVTYGLTYGSGSETVHTLAQMGILNLPVLAWELLPWSFVFDWFIPIGNYLSTLDATAGLTFVDGYCSTKTSLRHLRSQSVSGGVVINTSGSSIRSDEFVRTKLSSFPTASLPNFKNPVSIEHAINAIALLVGVKNKIISNSGRAA